MRCLACNKPLFGQAATLRYASTGEFLDLCKKCADAADIEYTANPILKETSNDEDFEKDPIEGEFTELEDESELPKLSEKNQVGLE